MTSLFGCNKPNPDDCGFILPPFFSWAFVDENDQNLFGQNAKYDYRNIVYHGARFRVRHAGTIIDTFISATDRVITELNISDHDNPVFWMGNLFVSGEYLESAFLFDFFSEKVDTIFFRLNRISKPCNITHFDAYFNSEQMCIGCRSGFYKIVIK